MWLVTVNPQALVENEYAQIEVGKHPSTIVILVGSLYSMAFRITLVTESLVLWHIFSFER